MDGGRKMKLGVLQDKIERCIKEQGGDLFDDKHFYVSLRRLYINNKKEFNCIRFYNSHYDREYIIYFNLNRWISAGYIIQEFKSYVKTEIEFEIKKIIKELSSMEYDFADFIPRINYYKDINKNKFKLELLRDRDYTIIYNSVLDQIEFHSYIVAGNISIIPIIKSTPNRMIENTIQILKIEYDKYLKQLFQRFREEI